MVVLLNSQMKNTLYILAVYDITVLFEVGFGPPDTVYGWLVGLYCIHCPSLSCVPSMIGGNALQNVTLSVRQNTSQHLR